jgi:hypothetical protein
MLEAAHTLPNCHNVTLTTLISPEYRCAREQKTFLVPAKDLRAILLILLLNCYLTAYFIEKYVPAKPIYLKIYHKSSLSNNLGEIQRSGP